MKGAVLAALVFLWLPKASAGQAGPDEHQATIEAQIEQLGSAGEFQAAMTLAHQIPEDPRRFALEADLLFRARSYRAALGRAIEAHDGGVRTPLLLARGIGSAIWLGDGAAAQSFFPDFDAAVSALPDSERTAWEGYAKDLSEQVRGLESQSADVKARVGLAKKVAILTLCLAVVLMAWLLPRSSE